MYHKNILILLFGIILLFPSCSHDDAVIDEVHLFEGAWNRFQSEDFVAHIRDNDIPYNLYCEVVVDPAQYQYDALPLFVNVYSESGERRMFRASLIIRDKQGVVKGERSEGKIVLNQCIRDTYFFNHTGADTIKIGQATQYYEVYGVKSLRLYIQPTAIEYPL